MGQSHWLMLAKCSKLRLEVTSNSLPAQFFFSLMHIANDHIFMHLFFEAVFVKYASNGHTVTKLQLQYEMHNLFILEN